MNISYQNIKNFKPHKQNARTHSAKQIRQLVRSIETFGFTNPILIDSEGSIIAGHGRVEAAKILGFQTLPAVELAYMSESQKRAYIIADNKLAENAGWDKNLLSLELKYIQQIDIDFDLEIIGFEQAEIDILYDLDDENKINPEEAYVLSDNPLTQEGDLWHVGQHKIYCGSALDSKSYEILLGSEKAQMVITDPPYNVPVNGHICGLGEVTHEEFKMASGEMSDVEFQKFLSQAISNMSHYSKDGSIHYICMDWRHVKDLSLSAQKYYTEFKNICVWNKTNAGMGSLYRSKHEFVFVYKNGKKPHINNIELGKHGRYRTNVWDYAGLNTFNHGREEDLSFHPTVKPVDLIKDAILDTSKTRGIILDPFGGSGSTLIAAEKTRRYSRLIEIEPKYVDVTLERFVTLTNEQPILKRTGETFAELKTKRGVTND